MARTKTLDAMAQDALSLADLENATNRFPTGVGSVVYGFVNKGIAHVWKEVVVVGGAEWTSSERDLQIQGAPVAGKPATVPLPFEMMQLLGVSWSSGPMGPWRPMFPYRGETERTELLNAGYCGGGREFRYGFASTPGAATASTMAVSQSLEVLPWPSIGSWVKVRFIPNPPELKNANDTMDAVLAFDDAVSTWAAILMRRKDDLETSALEKDFVMHMARVAAIAKRRDRSGPPRVQIVRGWGSGRSYPRRGGGRW